MILQSLVDYYQRKRAFDSSAMAPVGWEYRDIAFFVDLAEDGSGRLIDRRTDTYPRGRPLLVPAAENRSGTDAWKQPNLLWDHIGFVLGWRKRLKGAPDPADKPEKVARQHEEFRRRIHSLATRHTESGGLRAIKRFYECGGLDRLGPKELSEDLRDGQGLNVTFRVEGSLDPVCHEPWVSAECSLAEDADEDSVTGHCLVTGQHAKLARLHPKVSSVTGKPAPLVAANTTEAPAYSSYGKHQGLNSPVGRETAAQYSLALNSLLGRESRNRVRVGDAVTVIWADREDDIEPEIAALFGDDPDAHIEAVRQRLAGAVVGGTGSESSALRFFVLGLSPNVARISVRFWLHERFDRLGPRVLQHFDDLRIVRSSDGDTTTPSMFRLLCSISNQGKADNVLPGMSGEWMRAILEGRPYPPALLNAAVNRCRAEQGSKKFGGNVPYLRAALLKGCINREYRWRQGLPSEFQWIKEELDVNQTDPAYRLGRLFALLEHIQVQSARPAQLNSTIRDRFYGAASSTPGTVFPTLLRLKNAHMKKLAPGPAAFFEKRVGEICGSVDQPALTEFPGHLNLHAQGLFALGYYHQRESLYARRDAGQEPESNSENTTEEG